MAPTTAPPLSRSTILSAALSVSDSPLVKVPISSLSSASLICAWRTIEASYQGPASRPSDLNPAATVACVACLGILNLQGEARQVGLRVAFIVHREVLYAAPALSELNRVEEHLDIARVAPSRPKPPDRRAPAPKHPAQCTPETDFQRCTLRRAAPTSPRTASNRRSTECPAYRTHPDPSPRWSPRPRGVRYRR